MIEPPDLGPILLERRLAKKWTLDDLATKCGVSRSMLSQIERGQANPTFATLWGITQALGVDFQDFTTSAEPVKQKTIEIAPAGLTPKMETEDGNVVLRILSPAGSADITEWYELRFRPGGQLVSAPHSAGTTEHLTVLEGSQLIVRAGSATETVNTDATARYQADTAHEIRNETSNNVRALLVVMTGTDL